MSAAEKPKFPSYLSLPPVQYQVAGLLVVALALGEERLLRFCVLLLSLIFGAKLWGRVSLSRLSADARIHPPRIFPDETVRLTVTVQNRKALPVWIRITPPEIPALSLTSGEEEAQETGLRAFGFAKLDWSLIAGQRGVFRIAPLSLEAGDPLGFFPRRQPLRGPELVVYPRLVTVTPPPLARRDACGTPGPGHIEDKIYTQGLRRYQPGQPARYVDWKASARLGDLFERVGEPSTRTSVWLLVHVAGFENAPDAFERTLSAVASLAVHYVERKVPVGFISDGQLAGTADRRLPPSRQPGHLARLLETLARLGARSECDMRELLELQHLGGAHNTVLAFTLVPNEGLEALLARGRSSVATVECQACGSAVGGSHERRPNKWERAAGSWPRAQYPGQCDQLAHVRSRGVRQRSCQRRAPRLAALATTWTLSQAIAAMAGKR